MSEDSTSPTIQGMMTRGIIEPRKARRESRSAERSFDMATSFQAGWKNGASVDIQRKSYGRSKAMDCRSEY